MVDVVLELLELGFDLVDGTTNTVVSWPFWRSMYSSLVSSKGDMVQACCRMRVGRLVHDPRWQPRPGTFCLNPCRPRSRPSGYNSYLRGSCLTNGCQFVHIAKLSAEELEAMKLLTCTKPCLVRSAASKTASTAELLRDVGTVRVQ